MSVHNILLDIRSSDQMDVSIEEQDRFREGWQEVQLIKFLYFIRVICHIVQVAVLFSNWENWNKFYMRVNRVLHLYMNFLLWAQFQSIELIVFS